MVVPLLKRLQEGGVDERGQGYDLDYSCLEPERLTRAPVETFRRLERAARITKQSAA
jgi:hypothetical protein